MLHHCTMPVTKYCSKSWDCRPHLKCNLRSLIRFAFPCTRDKWCTQRSQRNPQRPRVPQNSQPKANSLGALREKEFLLEFERKKRSIKHNKEAGIVSYACQNNLVRSTTEMQFPSKKGKQSILANVTGRRAFCKSDLDFHLYFTNINRKTSGF